MEAQLIAPTQNQTLNRLKTDPEHRAWVIQEAPKARARTRHFDFIKWCWQRPDPFIEAKENPFQREICSAIDGAIEKYNRGISSFICFNLCFRHGKSDIASRFLPPHFLGQFPDAEVMVVSHSDDKANEFGNFGRNLTRSPEYRALYPGLELSQSNHGVQEWSFEGKYGRAQYFGIGSGSAGKGGNLIIIDDFFGKREHAESQQVRNTVWTSFTNDIIPRRAPVTIVLMVVTPWHMDDPVGRIKKEMKDNPDFPPFEFVSYPAFKDSYKSGYLFPERFSPEWYTTQKVFLGTYGTASLMNCDPQVKGGNRIRTDKIHIVSLDGSCSCGGRHEWPANLTYVRAWDLASSSKQTEKQDPDFTSGIKVAVRSTSTAVPGVRVHEIFIDDVIRGQWEAPKRDKTILDAAIADGSIRVGIEAFAAYKDAYTTIQAILKGIRSVYKMQLPGDKIAKASPLEPIFEAGNVYMRKAPWNAAVIQVINDFPGGAHDDDVDALAVGYNMCLTGYLPGIRSV